jgi:hypothetical protein
MNAWKSMPSNLETYASLDAVARSHIQLGVAISPNPALPLRFDPPVDREGHPVAAVLEKWREFNFFDPSTVAKNASVLRELSTIVLVVPRFDGQTPTPIRMCIGWTC